jgi:ABC-type nitrate/sulfonate/bicarbonate transport system substrate-binding protein
LRLCSSLRRTATEHGAFRAAVDVEALMQAFVQGQVDAAALSPPWPTRARQAGGLAPAELTVDALIDPTLAAEALRALDAERSR